MTLFRLGIQFVFVIDDDLTGMPQAERGSQSFHN